MKTLIFVVVVAVDECVENPHVSCSPVPCGDTSFFVYHMAGVLIRFHVLVKDNSESIVDEVGD